VIDPEEVRDHAYRWHRRYVLAAALGALVALLVLLIVW
jgi:hypothetical protein